MNPINQSASAVGEQRSGSTQPAICGAWWSHSAAFGVGEGGPGAIYRWLLWSADNSQRTATAPRKKKWNRRRRLRSSFFTRRHYSSRMYGVLAQIDFCRRLLGLGFLLLAIHNMIIIIVEGPAQDEHVPTYLSACFFFCWLRLETTSRGDVFAVRKTAQQVKKWWKRRRTDAAGRRNFFHGSVSSQLQRWWWWWVVSLIGSRVYFWKRAIF